MLFLARDLLLVLRDRELGDFRALVERLEDVDLLRDAVGEDVRVAMLTTYPQAT